MSENSKATGNDETALKKLLILKLKTVHDFLFFTDAIV